MKRWPAILSLAAACAAEVRPGECPEHTLEVSGVCRVRCLADRDCLYSDSCRDQVCLPREASEEPQVQLFEPDRWLVTRSDPTVRFDYVVTGADTLALSPAPGDLTAHAGTVEILLSESTDFVLHARAGEREDSKEHRIEVVDAPPPGELIVQLVVQRFEAAPCEEVEVRWTVVGDLEGREVEVRLVGDSEEIFSRMGASGREPVPLDAPKMLRLFARAGDLVGESSEVPARPALLCSLVSSPPAATLESGDTLLLEWETKGAASVSVEEVNGGVQLYAESLDGAETIGRWIAAPQIGIRRYRVTARGAPDRIEQLELSVEVEGTERAPVVDAFGVEPPWFAGSADLDIAWSTQGASSTRLVVNGASESLPGVNGAISRSVSETAEVSLIAERGGVETSAKKRIFEAVEEAEPNGTRDGAEPMRDPQSGAVVAKSGDFDLLAIQDVDWFEIGVQDEIVRVQVYDPEGQNCSALADARLSVELDGSELYASTIAGACPRTVLMGARDGTYRFAMNAPPTLIDPLLARYVLAVDVAPVVCGDGAIEQDEQCDDGNASAGDGCNPACMLESGFDYQVVTGAGSGPPPPGGAERVVFRPYREGVDDPLDEGFAIVPASIDLFGHHYAGAMIHVNGEVTLPDARISAFGADLIAAAGSEVLYWTEAEPARLVIAYRQMEIRDGGGPITFHVVIEQSGAVRFFYDAANVYPPNLRWTGAIADASGRYRYRLAGCDDLCAGGPPGSETAFVPR